MRFLVLGCGSAGRRHLANLNGLGHDVWATDQVQVALDAVAERYHLTHAVLDSRLDAAVIATSPHMHTEGALSAVRDGTNVFIEKPLSNKLDGVETLISEVEERGLVAQIGFNMRFHRDLMDLKQRIVDGQLGQVLHVRAEFGQWLPDWRPDRDYRQTYSAKRAEGGGAIMDAAVHAIDYVRWLVGSEVETVTAIANRTGALEIDCEDVADIILTFQSGVTANIHADLLDKTYRQRCVIVGTERSAEWNWRADDQMYVRELKHFISAIENGHKAQPDLREGKRVLEIALGARMSKGRAIRV